MTLPRLLLLALMLALSALATSAQHPAELTASRMYDHPGFRVAAQHIERDYDRFIAELVALTEVPAPPFLEEGRADAFVQLALESGLSNIERDEEGNVLFFRPGS